MGPGDDPRDPRGPRREDESVYLRRRLVAALAAAIFLIVVVAVIAGGGGGDDGTKTDNPANVVIPTTPDNLGDQARVILVNDWWPIRDGGASFNHKWRVIGINVRATTRASQETATFVFEEEVDI